MKSVMNHQFSHVPTAEIQRSTFDRSHGHKTTFNSGLLIPVYVDEALPGDTFNLNMSVFARLATPLKPIMDNMFLDSFFFAVPVRLLWEHWVNLNGERENPDDTVEYTMPYIQAPSTGGIEALNLGDYMGLPTLVPSIKFSALPFRAYNMIWNEWFRDQNIQDKVVQNKGDGPDNYADYGINRRGKRHDYFTSCLPWPQKGDAISIPLGTSAPVVPTSDKIPIFKTGSGSTLNPLGGTAGNQNVVWGINPDASGSASWVDAKLAVDLTGATAATINSLREAFQLQRLLERDARGGTRYQELLQAHFRVTNPDSRLQRPEYLGGGSTPINIHPVTQTSPTGTYADTPQGNLAAFGTASASGHGFTKSFTEHMIILGLVSVRADLTYQQGMERMWSRKTRWDHYWPALAHLGEQAVLNKEIFTAGTAADDEVFGYQERYAEYRYKPSRISGIFRSNYPTSLDFWHLSQDFAACPTLSTEFIEEKPPIERVIAVPSEPEFIFDSYFRLKCARPMPVYGVPGMIDHF